MDDKTFGGQNLEDYVESQFYFLRLALKIIFVIFERFVVEVVPVAVVGSRSP